MNLKSRPAAGATFQCLDRRRKELIPSIWNPSKNRHCTFKQKHCVFYKFCFLICLFFYIYIYVFFNILYFISIYYYFCFLFFLFFRRNSLNSRADLEFKEFRFYSTMVFEKKMIIQTNKKNKKKKKTNKSKKQINK